MARRLFLVSPRDPKLDALLASQKAASLTFGVSHQPLRLLTYRPGRACPDCDGENWWIGSTSAECGYCGSVLPHAVLRREGQQGRVRATSLGRKI